MMKMEDMPNPNEMMKKMMGDKKRSDMMKKYMKCRSKWKNWLN